MFYKHRFLIFLIVLVVFGLVFSPVLPVKQAILTITSPITKTLNNFSNNIRSFFISLKNVNNLAKENKNLKTSLRNLEVEIAYLNEVEHENIILTQELGFLQSEKEKNFIPSRIISRSTSSFLQDIIIDKGTKDGIKHGSPVVSQGYLIGVISQANDKFSQVQLITDSKTMIPVVLQQSRAIGLLKASLNGLFIEEIPIDNEVIEGEKILTSGLGEVIFQDLIIGQIEKVPTHKTQIFQTVKVKSPVEFSKLEMVFVIK